MDDNGNSIGTALFPSFQELVDEIRLLRLALELKGVAEKVGIEDLNTYG